MRRLVLLLALVVGALQDPAVDRMRAHIDVLSQAPREAGTAAEAAAVTYVAQQLRDLGLAPTTTDVPLVNGRTSHNVEVAFGDGPVEILLGAHIDSVHVSPGADDNGSGVAVLLEYARMLDAGTARVPPGTTVTLAWFGAEEILEGHPGAHHAGSRQLAAARAAAQRLPHWMLSVDMVGYGPTPYAVLLDGTDPTAARVLETAARFAGAPAAVAAHGAISDHEAFARAGTAAALLERPDNPGYHSSGDTVVLDDRLAAALRTVQVFVAAAASPFTTGRGMAQELVVDLLARRPDVAGAAHFGGRLDRGEGLGTIGTALLGSPEWADTVAPVARAYLAAFGRHADHDGLTYWTGALRRGASLTDVAAAFVASPEFAARYGAPDNRAFVELLYRNVLDRDADDTGAAYWTDQVDRGGATRAALLVAFAESPEHIARTATTLPVALAYAGLLRRPADDTGLAYWSTQPLADLVAGLVSSDEFRARFG